MECFRLHLKHLTWIEQQFLSGKKDSRKAGSLWWMMRGVGGVRKSIDQSWLAKDLGLGLLYWGFKGVQEEHSSNRVSSISTKTMLQSTTASLSQTIWARWASRQSLTLPIVQTLLPVTFAYSLSSEAVVMRKLRRWERLWRRSMIRSHKWTSMGYSRSCWNSTRALPPEEVTSKGTRVSCVYYLIKVSIRKKSGNLFNDPRMYQINWFIVQVLLKLGFELTHENSFSICLNSNCFFSQSSCDTKVKEPIRGMPTSPNNFVPALHGFWTERGPTIKRHGAILWHGRGVR